MKNKMITASNGFSTNGRGNDVNTACAPETPYTGDCLLCHVDGGDRSEYTAAMDAYAAGGTTLTDYFCPDPTPACIDNDNDGYGNPGDSSCAYTAEDCDDGNAAINPGAAEDCTDGIDNNCNGLVDTQDPNAVGCPADCTDVDGDTYSPEGGTCGPTDCNDNSASVNPGAFETCDDTVDNDCNGQTDCNDSSCSGDPACLAELCTDYTDRRSCKADSRCNWSGKLKTCSEPVVYTQQECLDAGGRWNKKKETCTIR
jgi:hypothetical protein